MNAFSTSSIDRTVVRRNQYILGSLLCLLMSLFSACPLAHGQSDRPNVVVILTDDQGWGDLSIHGNSNLSTPSIDNLARSGASFDRFYVCPVCSPTRAEFLTGRYHPRSGVYSTSAGGERMDIDEITIADTFKAAGYRTGAFGKWHNGMQYPYHPNGRGFEEYYGFCSGHWGDYFDPPLERNGQLVLGSGFCVDDFTTQALTFMQRAHQEGQPFFAYLPLNTPHSPMQVPDPYWEKFKDAELKMHHREPKKENLAHVRCALAMCENIDWNVGRILAKLEEWEIAENTIVVYFCDNGPNGFRWNGDMKGRKGSTDEGGVRSPCFVRWQNHIPAGHEISPIGAAIDLLPTLAELCEVPLKSTKKLDGTSLASLLLGDMKPADWPDRQIVSHWKTKTSVRNQRFRLDHQGALFEIAKDPGQRKDVAEQFPDVVATLRHRAETFLQEIEGYDEDERSFALGHPDYLYTQLPARDAVGTGEIRRSNRYPNCSYLSNWTSPEETIRFRVHVGCQGTYRVKLQYACQADAVGSELELTFFNRTRDSESRLAFKIVTPHDVPARGQEHDRVERAESYVKDFATAEIGEIHLTEGDGELVLSAKDIPGQEVMDFRLLFFERVE